MDSRQPVFAKVTPIEEDDQEFQDLTRLFRQRFLERFGILNCGELRESGYGSQSGEAYSVLAERVARILVEMIREFQTAEGD